MSKCLSVVYVSTATYKLTEDELFDLLEKSRLKNQAVEVTGMLLYDDGNFMQVIEGPHKHVRDLRARIAADTRHVGMITMLESEIDEREFPMWSMGFKNVSNTAERESEWFNQILDWREVPEEFLAKPSKAKKLLLSFRKNLATR